MARGEAALTRDLAAQVLKEFAAQAERASGSSQPQATPNLTAREREVLTFVAQGLTYKEVGKSLHLSEHTVKYHMGNILRRLHLKNREQAIVYARRAGWVKESE